VAGGDPAGDGDPSTGIRSLRWIARSSAGWVVVKWGLMALASTTAALCIPKVERKATVAVSLLAWLHAESELPEPLAKALR